MQTTKIYVANEDTMELQLMTQPIVDVATGDLYLKLDDVETLLTDIKANQTNSTQKILITNGVDVADVIPADSQLGLVTVTPGHVSTLNSTSSTLAGDATWTGSVEEVINHGVIQIIIKASHNSATNGMVIEYSPDGTNWDTSDLYTITGGTGKIYSFQPAARYYRVKYTNGSTQQTYFRLQTILKPYYVKPSSHRIGDLISREDDAELVKAVLTAEMPSGTFTPINATSGGNLKVAIEEFDPSAVLSVGEFAKKITVSGNDTYIATATIGTAQATAGWQAKKIAVSGSDTITTWADGNRNYDNVATNLSALSYS